MQKNPTKGNDLVTTDKIRTFCQKNKKAVCEDHVAQKTKFL